MSNKDKQLGMPFGTAMARLRKMILFDLLKRHGENFCYRCGYEIDNDELSIEHKVPWLHNDIKLFWDLNNISFSHLSCNNLDRRSRKRSLVHGTTTGYRYGCRCRQCTDAQAEYMRNYRSGDVV